MMNRTEHINWCKERSMEYISNNDISNAYASFVSDMNKHQETSNHSALDMGMMLMLSGNLNTKQEMQKFIEDFN